MDTRKKTIWMGSSRQDLRTFPRKAKKQVGDELFRLQQGEKPKDSKPFPGIGKSVFEIRARVSPSIYRIVYATIIKDAVAVLHCFEKKSMKTSRADVNLAAERYKELMRIK